MLPCLSRRIYDCTMNHAYSSLTGQILSGVSGLRDYSIRLRFFGMKPAGYYTATSGSAPSCPKCLAFH